MDDKQLATNHKLLMTNRKGISLTGILDVISFDLREILLETSEGMLTIKGSDLHINRLSVEKGDLEVEGKVDALLYSDVVSPKAEGENLFSRMFKRWNCILLSSRRGTSCWLCLFWESFWASVMMGFV